MISRRKIVQLVHSQIRILFYHQTDERVDQMMLTARDIFYLARMRSAG
jgi:hypothetical protein